MTKVIKLTKWRKRQFCTDFYGIKKQESIAQKLTDHSLLWAYFLPDHTNRSKEIIRKELQKREFSLSAIESWLPPPDDLTIPSIKPKKMSFDTYRLLVKGKSILFLSFRFVIVTTVLMISFASLVEWIYGLRGTDIGKASLEVTVNAFPNRAIGTLYYYINHEIGIIWGSLLILLPVSAGMLFMRGSTRILLLRPFGERQMTTPLKSFVVKYLGHFGYVYTLSDTNYKPNTLLTVLALLPVYGIEIFILILGPLLCPSMRIATVTKESRFLSFSQFLQRRYTQSFLSFVMGGQAFNIRSTDSWWKLCILTLMHSNETIVIDISKVKEGTVWEINALKERDLLSKCIFVISEKQLNHKDVILKRFFSEDSKPEVFIYKNNGTLNNEGFFQTALKEIFTRQSA